MNFESGSYPAGAQYDSNAPYNEPEPKDVDVTVSLVISKTFTIQKYDDEDLYDAIDKQIVLPNNLAAVVSTAFDSDLDLKAAGMPLFLKQAIEDSDDWFIDDCEIVPE
jgi:hypothetical protein